MVIYTIARQVLVITFIWAKNFSAEGHMLGNTRILTKHLLDNEVWPFRAIGGNSWQWQINCNRHCWYNRAQSRGSRARVNSIKIYRCARMLAHLRIGTGEDETEGFDGVELRQEAEAADVSGDTYPEHRQALHLGQVEYFKMKLIICPKCHIFKRESVLF